MDFQFKTEDILYLQEIKKNGNRFVPTREVKNIERIFKTIDPKFTLCNTCDEVIVSKTNKLISLVEKSIGCSILEYRLNEPEQEEEIWVGIKDLEERYAVSNLGRVKSIPKDLVLKTQLSNTGQELVTLSVKGVKVKRRVIDLISANFNLN